MKILTSSLQVLLDAIVKIEEYTYGYNYNDFLEDEKTFDAVLMQLQHIGETTRKIVDNFGELEELPTNEMIGLRNFIAHEYLGISISIIWDTIKEDLPELKIKIKKLINPQKLGTKLNKIYDKY